MKSLLLILALAAPASAAVPPYFGTQQSTATGRATMYLSGFIKIAASSQTTSAPTIRIDGVKGSISLSSAIVTYGITAATGTFSTGITVGTLSVTGATDFKTLTVSSQNATVMFEATRYGVINSTTQPAARWTRTSALSVPHDGGTFNVTLPNKEYDTQGLFAVSHATIPANMAGLYSIRAFASFATGTTGRRNLSVLKNGSVAVGCSDVKNTIGAADETRISVGCTLHLIAADTISMSVYQNEGSAQNVNSASLEIVKLW